MKTKIALALFCVISSHSLCAMQLSGPKRTYDEASTQRLQGILHKGWYNYRDEVSNLLDNGADPNIQSEKYKRRLIPLAIAPGDFPLLQKALECGVNPNVEDEQGDTALHKLVDIYGLATDDYQKTAALLLLAGASSTRSVGGSLALLGKRKSQKDEMLQAIVTATSLVKAEREAYNPGVAQLVSTHLPQPITGITMDFVGPLPIWDDGCWDLFQKHMAQAPKSDQVKRLK